MTICYHNGSHAPSRPIFLDTWDGTRVLRNDGRMDGILISEIITFIDD